MSHEIRLTSARVQEELDFGPTPRIASDAAAAGGPNTGAHPTHPPTLTGVATTRSGVANALDPDPAPGSNFVSDPTDLEPNREELMLDHLDRRERMRLVEFVCSFAWADLEVQPEERVFISRLIRRLELDEDEDLLVQKWLDRPPSLDGLDPTSIPAAHKRFFVEAIEGLIEADGEVAEEERESFEVFKQLLGS